MRLVHRLLLAIAAAAVLSACGPPPIVAAGAGREAVYEVPVDRLRRVLAAAEEPPMVFGDTSVDFELREEGPERFVWTVSQKGEEVMRYTADLEDLGDDGTRVSLTLEGTARGRFGSVEERLSKSESIRTMYLVAMQERIAADLERREFDMWKVYPAMTQATFDNPEIFTPPKDNSRANMKKAYRDELEAGRPD